MLERLEKELEISSAEMRRIMRDFRAEMEHGLAGKKSSLKMLDTFVPRPSGSEKGVFLALDLGGTNFRILELELRGSGRISGVRARKYKINRSQVTGSAGEMFDFLARCVKKFLKGMGAKGEGRIRLGFTFSFPLRQTAIDSGALLYWTKGFSARGVVGKDVVRLLKEALAREGVYNVEVAALVNDTVGTFAALAYEDTSCDMGVIIGTGTNACYFEESKGMIINTEWGNFNILRKTVYDKALDRHSSNPGGQILEKMVSGMYLGEVARLIAADFFGKKAPRVFKTEDMSAIEASSSKSSMILKKICSLVSTRAARISAAAIAAVIMKIDPNVYMDHTIAIDGSVYEKHPTFSKKMRSALREIFGSDVSHIRIKLAKDGSGKGAAIIAAAA